MLRVLTPATIVDSGPIAWAGLVFCIAMGCVILWRGAKHYYYCVPRCAVCGYRFAGWKSVTCPECGAECQIVRSIPPESYWPAVVMQLCWLAVCVLAGYLLHCALVYDIVPWTAVADVRATLRVRDGDAEREIILHGTGRTSLSPQWAPPRPPFRSDHVRVSVAGGQDLLIDGELHGLTCVMIDGTSRSVSSRGDLVIVTNQFLRSEGFEDSDAERLAAVLAADVTNLMTQGRPVENNGTWYVRTNRSERFAAVRSWDTVAISIATGTLLFVAVAVTLTIIRRRAGIRPWWS